MWFNSYLDKIAKIKENALTTILDRVISETYKNVNAIIKDFYELWHVMKDTLKISDESFKAVEEDINRFNKALAEALSSCANSSTTDNHEIFQYDLTLFRIQLEKDPISFTNRMLNKILSKDPIDKEGRPINSYTLGAKTIEEIKVIIGLLKEKIDTDKANIKPVSVKPVEKKEEPDIAKRILANLDKRAIEAINKKKLFGVVDRINTINHEPENLICVDLISSDDDPQDKPKNNDNNTTHTL